MDQQGRGEPPAIGIVSTSGQVPYGTNPYQPNQMSSAQNPGSVGTIQSTGKPAEAQLAQNQLAYQQIHHQQQQLQSFWANQYQEVDKVADFKNHSLPLARIKKIMKADEDGINACWGPADALSYGYMPHQHAAQVGTPGMIMGKPVMDPAIYTQQSHAFMTQQMWPQQGSEQQQAPSDH
ncbi:hypothetical protein GH714_008971 [Hevea brasiliensis]|uniref:Uncharacterized protein n=1 Tax=Hevea brasiliensis TaxID=3981 RepID=A0A6A6KAK0_HEVBR|nr:hypothetical protein GH714_008971 [Hevea brasiliensis]